MKKRFLFLVFLPLLILASLPAHAQRRTGSNPMAGNFPMSTSTIQGFVRSAETAMGLYRARVQLNSFAGGQIGSMQITNQEGEFIFLSVPAGNYELSAQADGYAPGRQLLQVSEAFGGGGVDIFLKPLAASAPGARGGVVSARELALPPKVKKDYMQGVSALYEKNKPQASLPFFSRVIAQAPDFYPAYHHAGVAYEMLRRNQEAEASLRKALELCNGRDGMTQLALAAALLNQNRFSEAEPLARQGLAAYPGTWAANYQLARALVGLRRTDEAEKVIQELLRLNPKLPQAYLLLASVHIQRTDGVSLIKDLDNYLRRDPKGPQSDWAKKLRERVQKRLAEASAAGTPPAPHP